MKGNPDTGAYRYLELMHALYKFASTAAVPLSTRIFETLIVNFKDDYLAFLGGVWTNSADSELRTTSLRHAAAFLEAHNLAEKVIDFQTILPSLLAALQTVDAEGKAAVLECLSQLVRLTKKRFSAVYGMDTIYGDNSGRKSLLTLFGCLKIAEYLYV